MLPNAFIGMPHKPGEKDLAAALGPVEALWDELVSNLAERKIDVQEWNSYSKKAGWSLRLKHEKRIIVYLSPSQNAFMASFALGDRAVQAAHDNHLPQWVIKIIDEAKRYAEGTAVRIEVKSAKDTAEVRKLAEIKLAN